MSMMPGSSRDRIMGLERANAVLKGALEAATEQNERLQEDLFAARQAVLTEGQKADRLRQALDPDICLACGERHEEIVLTRYDDGTTRQVSWLKNGHAYRRRSYFPDEWAEIARRALGTA